MRACTERGRRDICPYAVRQKFTNYFRPELPVDCCAFDASKSGNESMNPGQLAVVISICLFFGMAICLEVGYCMGSYVAKKTEAAHEGTSTIQAAVFALLGLLLGFTFANVFRQYLDTRLEVYEKLPDLAAAREDLQRAAQLQQEIWSHAIAGSRDHPTQNAARLLLPASNDMIDVTTSRTIAYILTCHR